MTDSSDTKRKRKPRSLIGNSEMAAILVFARLHGAAKAAKEFAVAERTITRKRSLIAKGQAPELAALVRESVEESARKHANRLDAAFDGFIDELQSRRKDATIDQLINATKMLGELRITRDSLKDDEFDSPDREGAGASEVEGPATGREASAGTEPSSGHQAGAGVRSVPVH